MKDGDKVARGNPLQSQQESATMQSSIPDGMILVPVAEYQKMKQAFLELQQVVNPLFGLDRLQTGKQKRRDARQ